MADRGGGNVNKKTRKLIVSGLALLMVIALLLPLVANIFLVR